MKKIFLSTAAFHLFLLMLMLLSYRPHKKPEPATLLVQTVQLQPPPPKKPRLQPRPKPKVIAQKAPQPKPVVKPVAKKVPPQQKKTKEILNNLEKSFAKLESKTSPLPLPKKIETAAPKPLLKEILIASLQRELILPEMGNVQVKLAVDSAGKITILKFLTVESEANRQYIEEKLSTITLPSFDKREESYILTFTNRDQS